MWTTFILELDLRQQNKCKTSVLHVPIHKIIVCGMEFVRLCRIDIFWLFVNVQDVDIMNLLVSNVCIKASHDWTTLEYSAHWMFVWDVIELLSKHYLVQDVLLHCLQFLQMPSFIPSFIARRNHSFDKIIGLFIKSFPFLYILIRRQRRERYLDLRVGVSQYISSTEDLLGTQAFSEI